MIYLWKFQFLKKFYSVPYLIGFFAMVFWGLWSMPDRPAKVLWMLLKVSFDSYSDHCDLGCDHNIDSIGQKDLVFFICKLLRPNGQKTPSLKHHHQKDWFRDNIQPTSWAWNTLRSILLWHQRSRMSTYELNTMLSR